MREGERIEEGRTTKTISRSAICRKWRYSLTEKMRADDVCHGGGGQEALVSSPGIKESLNRATNENGRKTSVRCSWWKEGKAE